MPVYNLTPNYNPLTGGTGLGSPSSAAASTPVSRSVGSSSGTSSNTGTSANQALSQNRSVSSNQQTSATAGGASNQSSGSSFSGTYIPEYSQTPILENIAKYSAGMADKTYNWGMQQYDKNQGNIDNMMKTAQSYASPQRQAQEMGQAQAGVMQGAEQGRQNSIRDLQSYGIDPSSGRYAALDNASRVSTGAMAAGAGNQQRMATEAAGNTMQNQALSASMQNQQVGYGAANAANQFAATGMALKYSPLGTTSSSANQSTGDSWNESSSQGTGTSETTGFSSSAGTSANAGNSANVSNNQSASGPATGIGAPTNMTAFMAEGGEVPDELSDSGGNKVDDVKANLTAGEFIIPKDIVEWKGQEFFYKLMAQTRKMRATSGGEMGGGEQAQLGYGAA